MLDISLRSYLGEMNIQTSNKNAVSVKNIYYGYRRGVKVIKNLSLKIKMGKLST